MKIYITGTSSISPQHTFEAENYLKKILAPGEDYFSALEPDYKNYIDPRLSRRMSRIIKMSVAAAGKTLSQAKTEQPGAILVGTGLGCLQDTEKFLTDLIENKEGLLSPTSFIQSTHNTIAGQIALLLECPNHNFTYAQRGHSFENALQDGIMQLKEGVSDVLLGGVDEITQTLSEVLKESACADKPGDRYPKLEATDSLPATGEGATFFSLSAKNSPSAMACLEDMHCFYNPKGQEEIEDQISKFMAKSAVQTDGLDAIMMGFNGSTRNDAIYHKLTDRIFPNKTILSFKNLCGEYFTASAFGLHLALNTLHKQEIFNYTLRSGDAPSNIKNILLYNHYKGKYHTLILLSKCQPL
ncbi:MAG: beta-ketoacyl synthase chain length factor [Cytophagaceae bacterium]